MKFWTDERIETVTRLWLEGKTGNEIAQSFGVSRSMVVGKVIRLGIKRPLVEKPKRIRPEPKTLWTADKEALLSRLWLTPLTRAQIAEQLGEGFTEFGVGSKAKRLNLADRRVGPLRPARKAPTPTERAVERQERAAIKEAFKGSLFEPLDGTTPRSFMERRLDECTWPITGPDDSDGISRLSCCAPKIPNSSYCKTHAALGASVAGPYVRPAGAMARSRRVYR